MGFIKSYSFDETEIHNAILKLYCDKDYFEMDPCYSYGKFYKKTVKKPMYKFDICPKTEDTIKADVRNLPMDNCSVSTIMFDPPFVIGLPNKSKGDNNCNMTYNRFGGFKSKKDQTLFYYDSLTELYRVLKPNGIIAFKCQDTVSSGIQYMVHNEIITMANKIGYYVEDLFILIRQHRMNSGKWKIQRHSRKHHCYYIVLRKIEHR